MTENTLEQTMYDSMGRITQCEATETDLALVFIMSEFIDALGGVQGMEGVVGRLEARWKIAQGEYARGEV